MEWKTSIGGSLGLLLAAHAVASAQGNQITAIVQPASDIAVTVQIVVSIIASLLILATVFLIVKHEAAGFITLAFTILAIVVAIKAGDILAFFGPGRAIAQALLPVVISAEQALLDQVQTLLVHGAWLGLGLKGIVHGRRATGL